MKTRHNLSVWVRNAVLATAASLCAWGVLASGPLGASPETLAPLGVIQAGKPMVMLTVGRDHTLFYEAYNDASDIDGDGQLDLRFNPRITYLGLFNSGLCYSYSGVSGAEARRNDNTGLFRPAAHAGALGVCSAASHWSGNWLNWATTSRIDALRVVLYGGYREVDTATQTILRRAYIPQDAHSWAKEYTSVAVDGYDIRDFTPLGLPSGAGVRRHFFGNLTDVRGRNCATLNDCSGRAPLLRVVENARDARVWQWATTERPVLHEANNLFSGTRTDHTVRVEVCTPTFFAGCQRYPNGNFKPTGVLHSFGENDAMLFGLITGSYNRNMSGGVLRDVVSSFRDEVNPSNGTFTAQARIVNTLDALRIRGFNNARTDNAYFTGWVTNRSMTQGEFVDWGNPMGEMMYEALRYFAGRNAATSVFATTGGDDAHIGLPVATWDDPFAPTSAAQAAWCARPNLLVVSGINPSFDSDQVPGTAFGSFSGDLAGLNVSALGQTIADHEPGVRGMRFIGESGGVSDGAPTAKNVTSLGNIRGLAPEAPTQQGSFSSSAIAHFGKITDLRPTLQGTQNVDTFAVALSSPLPTIEVPTSGGRTFSLVPFAKSVGGSGISNTKGAFQPTNQIVDFYVDTIANSCREAAGGVASMCRDFVSTVNGGRYFARFRINFEDVEQGADHDMDAVVIYEISLQADGRLRVRLTPEYQAGGIQHSMGYVMSGSTADGVYLVVQDEAVDRTYHLNVPPGRSPGFCDVASPHASCSRLPHIGGAGTFNHSQIDFTASATPAASLLRDPLWYAAKWGGFVDRNNNNRPDLRLEWDLDNNSVPDTYFLVQNPARLRDSLDRAFTNIFERSAAAGNVAANSTSITTETAVFQSIYNSGNWSGDLLFFPVTATGVASVEQWRASARLPAHTSRRIFTNRGTATVAFARAALDATQTAALGSDAAEQDRNINFLRGDRSQEVQNGGELRNRSLTNVLGDIVHSSPVYVRDSNTVFVGSNGGKLHAFNATSGVEQFAFVPPQNFQHLRLLTDPNYNALRRYFVDGEIAVSERTHTGGRNLLVAFYGRGGRGLFALDVTDPASFGNAGAASRFLWDRSAAANDADMGYLLGRPLIARVKRSGGGFTNAVIFGNGYNSTNGDAVLFVMDLATGAVLARLGTGSLGAGSNGLGSPGVLLNADGTVDYVYAGDLRGNVWKFDLTSTNPAAWGSDFMSGGQPAPLFTAINADGQPQPITAPITVARNTVAGDPHHNKVFVLFGTGSYMAAGDPANLQVQSVYGLIDDGGTIAGRSVLRQRRIAATGIFDGRPVRTFESATPGDMVGRRGWFMDLLQPTPSPNGTPEGERVVSAVRVMNILRPSLLFSSIIPVVDPCIPGGRGFINAIHPFTGASLFESTDTVGIFDLNQTDFTDDKLGTVFIGSFDLGVGLPSEPVLVGDRLVVGGSQASIEDVKVNLPTSGGAGAVRGRISWREIVR